MLMVSCAILWIVCVPESPTPNVDEKPLALVVDDDETIREFLHFGLTRLGYEVTTANDGMAAFALCMQQHYALVVCDIRMPKLSVLSFLKNARSRNPDAVQRVIFVSSLSESSLAREVAQAGGAALLSKPFTMAQLTAAIAAAA